MKTSIEKRTISAELRADGSDDQMLLCGYAASFNVLSPNVQGFRERISPGAFKRTLAAKADVRCLLNHDASRIYGRTKAGTLAVAEDDRGLRFRCQLDENQQSHRDLYAAIKRGDIGECSFAFRVAPDGDVWDEAEDERGQKFIRRTLRDLDLLDVSACTYPYYADGDATTVAARIAGQNGDEAKRSRCAAIGKQILADRIKAALQAGEDDKVWLARMAGIPNN